MNELKTHNNIFEYSEYFAHKDDSLVCKDPSFDINTNGTFLSLGSIFNSTRTHITREPGHIGVKRYSSIEQSDGIFVILLICFALLIHIYKRGVVFFKENIRTLFYTRIDANRHSEATTSEFWYGLLLIFQCVFLYSIVVFVFFFESDISEPPNYIFPTVMGFVLLIAAIEGLKYLFYKSMGSLFNLREEVSIWLRSYSTVIEMTGIIAFIPVLLLIYFDYYHNTLFIFFFLLFIISRLIIICKIGLFFLQKNVNFLYLIAYLCSVEIIPYILLYSGLIYLYKIDIISLL